MEENPTPPPPVSPAVPPPPPAPQAFPQMPPSSPPPPPQTPTKPQSGSVPPKPTQQVVATKRGLPLKKTLFFLFVILLLGAGAFALYRFVLNRPANSGPTTITYWGLWESEQVMAPVIAEFEKINPDVKVDYRMQSVREYRERLASAISQNQGPDIMRIHASWIPMFIRELATVPDSVYTPTEFESTFYPAARDLLKFGNSYYGVPVGYDGLVMYVNDDLLSAANLSVPKTWDELRLAAVGLSSCFTETGACQPGSRINVSGVSMGLSQNVDHWEEIISALLVQNNVNLSAPSGQPAEDAFAYYAGFTRSLGIWNADMPKSTESFAAGKVGIYFAPSWRVFEIKQANPNLRFSLHPIPQLPVDLERNEKPVEWASFWVEGVNKRSQKAEASWKFIKFLSSREGQQVFATAAKNTREFGEPFARTDMADQLKLDPYLSPVITQANLAKSWYLVSSTFDGANGLNTKLSEAFAKSVAAGSLGTLSTDVSAILAEYGLTGKAPTR